jgi:hypothetical protein
MRWPPYIRSYNNMKVTFLDLKHEQIQVESIFLHLAKACRYNGMVDGWYSNAEHSMLGAARAPSTRLSKWFLIHDFGEYITNDVPGPVKTQCPDYKFLCNQVQDFMYSHFMGTSAVPAEVKDIDLRMYATEQHFLRKAPDEDLNGIVPYEGMKFHQWEWREAYAELKKYFYLLFPEYKDAV